MDKPLVSVVTASYNCGQYIAEAINSALNQTYPNIEIIVVNDGSNDNTLEVLQQFEGKIKLINQENKGVAAAKNRGIEAAKGEYIAFLDADDMLEPGYIETALWFIREHGLDAISFGFFWTDEKRNIIGHINPINYVVTFEDLVKNSLPLNFWVIKRHFLPANAHDEKLTFSEDHDIWLRILKGKAKWYYHADSMAYYMVRQGSICHTYQKDITNQLWRIYSKHKDSLGTIKAWLCYRRHLGKYRYAMLRKSLKAKQLAQIIKHAWIATKSPFYLPLAIRWLFNRYSSSVASSK